MTYKETLYFVAACLTISFEDKGKEAIKKQLKSGTIDWDTVVRGSTSHYVLPALYYNLKRESFLHYLPQDLVAYMKHIASLNRERNQQLITQAKELNTLLLANNVNPIFLKGMGNLLAGLYDNIAERMVGDIDFLVSKEEYLKAITVLRDNGYSDVGSHRYHFPAQKHYRRLKKENNIAAVEIHKELLLEKYVNEFNYSLVIKDSQIINGITVLSYANKLNLSIISHQIDDNGFYYKTIALRNAYDVFLLSKKTNAKDAVKIFHKLKHPLNCFLASCFEVFNRTDSLEYHKTKETASYLTVFNSQFEHTKKTKRNHKRIKIYLFIKDRLNILFKSILYKEYRVWLFKRLTEKR